MLISKICLGNIYVVLREKKNSSVCLTVSLAHSLRICRKIEVLLKSLLTQMTLQHFILRAI
jgi:hypothetical protein